MGSQKRPKLKSSERVAMSVADSRQLNNQCAESDIEQLTNHSQPLAMAVSQSTLERLVHQQVQLQMLINQLTSAIRNNWRLDDIFQLALTESVSAIGGHRGLILTLKSSNSVAHYSTPDWIPQTRAVVECEMSSTSAASPTSLSMASTLNSAQLPLMAQPMQDSLSTAKPSFAIADCPLSRYIFSNSAEAIAIASLTDFLPKLRLSTDAPEDAVSTVFQPGQMKALLVIPIANQGTYLGCMIFQQAQTRQWHSNDVAFAQLIGNQLSTAIIQSHTLRQVQSLVDKRTMQLKHSLDVQAKLYEKTRQQVNQLQLLAQRQDEFLSSVSHELLTPLTSMRLAIRMLRQTELSSERRAKYLDILEQQCNQETNLVNDLLALQKLELKQNAACQETVDICSLLQEMVQPFAVNWQEKNLTLRLALPASAVQMKVDVDSLHRIWVELLTNAGKYAQPQSDIQLSLSTCSTPEGTVIVMEVVNVGMGICSDELPYIFDKFRRGQGVTQQAIPGTGLGLALVKGLVEHLGGSIQVESTPLDNSSVWQTCFKLLLPQISL